MLLLEYVQLNVGSTTLADNLELYCSSVARISKPPPPSLYSPGVISKVLASTCGCKDGKTRIYENSQNASKALIL